MLCGLLCLSLQDALIKMISTSTTLWQLQTLRATCNLLLLCLLARQIMPGASLKPQRVGAVALRSLFQVGALTLFFSGAPFLTLAQMAGGLYTFPLFVGVLGLLFGEAVGMRRIGAIVVGFLGTMLVIKPAPDAFQLQALLPVGAGFFYALFVVTTRRLCRNESPLVLVLGSNVGIVLVGIAGLVIVPILPVTDELRTAYPFVLTVDAALTISVVVVILSTSFLNTSGNLCLSKAYQSADSTFLAPIDYSYLLFAAVLGMILFNEIPSVQTVTGLSLIAGAGLFVAWRERVAQQAN